jgi:hypothetical protein
LGLDRLDIAIVGLNPAQVVDACPRISVLCCRVKVDASNVADPPSRESYQIRNWFVISEEILNWNRSQSLIRKAVDYDDDGDK